jgi:hypothetical protein
MKQRACIAAILAITLAARAAAPAPPTPPAPATQPAPAAQPDESWSTLLRQLGADDFAQRDAAQKQLDQTTWRELPRLQQFADAATDAEVKARLADRIRVIQEDLAVNPPPISIELHNASLSQVAAALSKALGVPLESQGATDESYTLSATDKPFWEIFLALSRQHPLALQDNGASLNLIRQSNGMTNGFIQGPIAIFPTSLTRTRTVSPQADPAAQRRPENLSFSFLTAFDPRLRIARLASPVISEIRDVDDNTLFKRQEAVQVPGAIGRNISLISSGTSLILPEKHSDRIALIKGDLRCIVQTREEQFDFSDLANKVGQEFQCGSGAVRLTDFRTDQRNPASVAVNLSLSLTRPPQPIRVMENNESTLYPTATLLDSTGKIVTSSMLTGSLSSGLNGAYTPPFKLRISVPSKVRDVQVSFQFKNLPIP